MTKVSFDEPTGPELLSLPQDSSSKANRPESLKRQAPQPQVMLNEQPVIVWRPLMLEQ